MKARRPQLARLRWLGLARFMTWAGSAPAQWARTFDGRPAGDAVLAARAAQKVAREPLASFVASLSSRALALDPSRLVFILTRNLAPDSREG